MANTYTLIASNTLSSSAASVTFSSIPNTYTDLVLKISVRNSGTTRDLWIEYNADTASNYSATEIWGYAGTSVVSINTSSQSKIIASWSMARSDFTSNTFSNVEMYIPNYNATTSRPSSLFAANENNSSDPYAIVANAGLYRGSSAISSIKISPANNNFVSGSSFFLYGIKNS